MTDNSNIIGQVLGQYRILEPLGTGGMATVYRAHQVTVDREVAIKVIRSDLSGNTDFVKRFEREARLVAQLRHPHILKLFDFGQQGNVLYLVMELMTSGTLADMIKRGPLTVPVTVRMLDQLGSALDYAHERNIIHRDLKPQNVLLDDKENATLSDFGVARLLQENLQLTQTGMAMGTPPYMSPEQWRGDPLDARVDIYALGVMLYEMLTGKLPFYSETAHGMMYQHLMNFPPSLRTHNENFPPAVDAVLNQALAKDREARFSKASQLAEAFRSVVGGIQGTIGSPSPSGGVPIRPPTGSVGVRPTTGQSPQAWFTPGQGMQPPAPTPTPSQGQPNTPQGMDQTAPMRVDPYQTQAAYPAYTATPPSTPSQTRPPAPIPPPAAKSGVSPALLAGIAAIVVLGILIVVILLSRSGNGSNNPQALNPTIALPTNAPTPTPSAAAMGVTRTDGKSVQQVGIPAGCFKMGSDPTQDGNAGDQEQPQHLVCITKPFWLDRTEVTNADYQKFVDEGGYTKKDFWSDEGWKWLQTSGVNGPENRDKLTDPNQPRLGINWYEAQAYAKWRGGNLPTEAQWEYAARGPNAQIYPWGNSYQNGKALINEITRGGKSPTTSVAVGTTADDKSWVGAMDMAGNVCEWTTDWYSDGAYAQSPKTDPPGPAAGDRKTVRGGSWVSSPTTARTAFRTGQPPVARTPYCGFRVVSESPVNMVKAPLKFTILHTSETHANHLPQKDDIGGDARIASLVKQIRDASPNTLLVDVGGRFTGTLFHRVFAGQDNVQIMNALGYQVMGIGNPEFDNREAVLAQFISGVQFPVISANIDVSKIPELAGKIKPYTTLDVGGQKVGVIGLTIADTPQLSSPSANVKFDKNYATVVQQQVVELQGQGINKIVLLSYLGYEQNIALAAQLSGVAIIIGGRDGVLLSNVDPKAKAKYPTELKDSSGKPILLVQSGDTTRYLGRLNVEFDADGNLVKWDGDSILLDKSILTDKDVESLIRNLSEQVDLERSKKIRSAGGDEINVAETLNLNDCRLKECLIGNLVADAMRDRGNVQIALMNAGGIRNGLTKGTLLRGAILELLPFNNRLSTFKLSGADIVVALENGVSRVGSTQGGTGRFPQVSGLRFTYDASKPVGSRILSVDVLGADGTTYAPIDPKATYTVASNDFERKGGDDYAVFALKGTDALDLDVFLDDVFTQYIQKMGKVEPKAEDRIKVVNPPPTATPAPTATKAATAAATAAK